MSFAEQSRRTRTAPLVAVAAVHAAIGYALMTGLATRVIHAIPVITTAREIPDIPPPPEHSVVPPKPVAQSPARPHLDDRVVVVPLDPTRSIDFGRTGSTDAAPGTATAPSSQPDLPPAPNLSRDLAPAGNHGGWVTAEDYPAAALRAGAEGVAAISVLVGIDGRVAACDVTASSGNAALDAATCRTYSRRARFRAALDAAGNPVVARHADRIRWRIPE